MLRKIAALKASAIALLITPAHAEFSKEWNEYAEEVKADCAEFEESARDDTAAVPTPRGRLEFPSLPRGAPARPHICMFFRFDVNAEGVTVNIETAFKGPENLHHRWVRDARLAVKDWKFNVPPDRTGGYTDIYARIDYSPVKAWTYRGWVSLFAGVPAESSSSNADASSH